MGTPPSYTSFSGCSDIPPTKRQEAEALESNPAVLRSRIAALESKIEALTARVETLETGR